jgi:hypothetical protein
VKFETMWINVAVPPLPGYGINRLLGLYSPNTAFKNKSNIPLLWHYTVDAFVIDSSDFQPEVVVFWETNTTTANPLMPKRSSPRAGAAISIML